jgi:para-nitrobenzyl esterase
MSAYVDGAGSAILRRTEFGPIEGVDDSGRSGTYAWLGVPFARPPVGALRWKAPVDPDPWAAPLPAKAFGNASVQCGSVFGPGANNSYDMAIAATLNQMVGSEDCLYLNIWRPATAQGDLPVIVFIHGGSNVAGFTADSLYNGANLARVADAVVVNVNYRLSIFGWLSLPQLHSGEANDDSGNFGTLDNIHALRWVKRNIGAFGGNDDNVTLMGHSAGATNALVLMVASQTRAAGLFHRVVAISGGISLASNLAAGSMPFLQPAAYYAAQARALLHGLLVADGAARDEAGASAFVRTQTNAQTADYLRAKSPAAILTVLQSRLAPQGPAISFPIPDGKVLPVDPIGAIAA